MGTNLPFQGDASGIDVEAQEKHGPFEMQGNYEVSSSPSGTILDRGGSISTDAEALDKHGPFETQGDDHTSATKPCINQKR